MSGDIIANSQETCTDCIFIVGHEEEEPKRVHAVKATLMMASPYMRNLFAEKWHPGKTIRIFYNAKIFKTLVEFPHDLQERSKLTCEKLADLYLAADYFLFEGVKRCCVGLLKMALREDLNGIWPLLDKIQQFPNTELIIKICAQFLSGRTEQCLAQPSFLNAQVGSVILLVKQDSLHLSDEHQLIQKCIKWAEKQRDGVKSMRLLLPYLRLLTLQSGQIAQLPDFLELAELGFLLKHTLNKGYVSSTVRLPSDIILPKDICCITQRRKFTKSTRHTVKRKSCGCSCEDCGDEDDDY